MRKLVLILTFFITSIGFSQVYEIGFSHNYGNIMGEINREVSLNSFGENWGFIIKKNMNPRIAYRLAANSLNTLTVNYFDVQKTQITEISAGIDFNLTKYNLIRRASTLKSVAYIIFEATGIIYNSGNGTEYTTALPMGIGYKHAITKRLVCSLEAKGRVSFSDRLDNVTTNKSTLDGYYFVGASMYFTFGWPRGSKNQTRF